MRRSRIVLAAVALVVTACSTATTPPAAPFTRPPLAPRTSVTGSPVERVLEVGDDFQAVVDASPPGSNFTIASGVHRMQQVIPHDGDTFRGQPGAVMNGARLLDPGGFEHDGDGRWSIGGQHEDGLERGQPGPDAGPAIREPEELFADGRRLRRVEDLADLGPGRFHVDEDAGRLSVAEDPSELAPLEFSVTPFAFGGTGVRSVTIEDVVVEKYASPAQFAAVGGAPPEEFPYDWVVRRVEARLNHGGGIGVAPGITIEDSHVHHNGQIGLVGWGEDRSGEAPGYSAPVTIRRTRIHDNNVLGFDPSHEAGGTKIKGTREGSLLEQVWSHDNDGPGIWYDVENRAATIRSNLVEDNTGPGIFYEISSGPTTISDNLVRRNGLHEGRTGIGAGILVSNADDVTVTGNVVLDNGWGIVGISRGDREPPTFRLTVRGNDITMRAGWTGLELARDADPALLRLAGGNRFEDNTYRLEDEAAARFFWDGAVSWTRWQQLGHDRGGRLLEADDVEAGVAAGRRFERGDYGPRWSPPRS